MGRWQDAADSIQPKVRGCGYYKLLLSLDPAERKELEAIAATAPTFAYISAVIVKAGGPRLDPQNIATHLRGRDSCPAS